jgi:hypothetical protein
MKLDLFLGSGLGRGGSLSTDSDPRENPAALSFFEELLPLVLQLQTRVIGDIGGRIHEIHG